MSFRFYFDLTAGSDNSLKVDFTQKSSHYYSSTNTANKAAIAAFEPILIFVFNLVHGKDFETCFKEEYTHTESSCTIRRSENIALILDFLLSEKGSKMFPLSHVNGYKDAVTEHCMQIRNKHLIDCIENTGKLTMANFDKISALMLAHLNAEYAKLKQEPLVMALKENPVEHYGNALLKHPFYQTLCFLQQDYTTRSASYGTKGFFEKMTIAAKPDINQYTSIYKKYIHSVPDCYCDLINKEKIFSEKKINNARVTIVENNNIQNNNIPPHHSTLSRPGFSPK